MRLALTRMEDFAATNPAPGQIIAEGPPESISQNQAVVDAYLGVAELT